jgi:hypothetical protein
VTQRLTRLQLHELAWSIPLSELASQFSVSAPTLKNACIKFDIPIPSRGHWAKVQGSKPTIKVALPERSPGMGDEVYVGARYYWQRSLSDEELLGPLPEPPTFPDDIAEIRERVRKTIGQVRVGRVITLRHAVTSKLLAQDEARRETDLRDAVRAAAAALAQRPVPRAGEVRRQAGAKGQRGS